MKIVINFQLTKSNLLETGYRTAVLVTRSWPCACSLVRTRENG